MSEYDYSKDRHTLRRLADAISYHLTALSVIPFAPDNDAARDTHEKLLLSCLEEMKELLK